MQFDYLSGVDMDEVMRWYNGYSWLGEKVCNPFDILLYLDSRQFRNYWFETATPTFLIRLLEAGNYPVPELNNLKVGETQGNRMKFRSRAISSGSHCPILLVFCWL